MTQLPDKLTWMTENLHRFIHSAGGKKKISKAERLRLLREEEERRLFEEEQARIRAELEEAARLEKERIEREKRERLEAKDQERRGIEIAELQVLEENFFTASQLKMKSRALAKWKHYTGCDGTPDPTVAQEINTFMSLWQEDKNNDINAVIETGNGVLDLIEKLELCILDTPFHELSPNQVTQYQDTIFQLQALLHHKYNEATEQLLKQASSYAESESGNMEVVIKKKNVTLCVWANLKKNPRFRSQCFYDEEKEPCNGFDLPKPLAICDIAVRILHTHYDHLSPCLTFPKEPPKLEIPAPKPMTPVSSVDEKGKKGRKSPSREESKSDATANRIRSYSEVHSSEDLKSFSQETENTEESNKKSCSIIQTVSRVQVSSLCVPDVTELEPLEDFVVDLHQFLSVGGIYHFDVLKLPPQAKQVKGWTMVEVLDTGLEVYPYIAVCEENEDPSAVTVGITVRLLDNVIYFEEPLLARWDKAGKSWRTDDIGEVEYRMKEKEISFKMNGFFTVTLLQDAHLNMPYQSWELRPIGINEALLMVLTTFAEVQIHIKANQCMLTSVTTIEETDLLSEMKGKWTTPLALMMTLKRSGMNIFPAEYSSKYVSINKKLNPHQLSEVIPGFASVRKWSAVQGGGKSPGLARQRRQRALHLVQPAEVTSYQQMALVASAFAFGWSKWNSESGEDNVVFKACEHLTEGPVKEESWALYMFNGQRAQRLELTEESETFSRNIAENTEFHSTLYHLIRDASSEMGMERVNHAHCLFTDAVYQLLLATKVLTYS